MQAAVVIFPGSNCDRETVAALRRLGATVRTVFHTETDLRQDELVVLPGGFSYGDYLRAGAIARFSPVMQTVVRHAAEGGRVLGICNGFQILCEAGLLPGALLPNADLRFHCETVTLRVEREDTALTAGIPAGTLLSLPIAHGEGNYFLQPEDLGRLEEQGQVLLRYTDASGRTTEAANPNGSLHHIAGIRNRQGNVFGLMPHPERASGLTPGSTDGARLLTAVLGSAASGEGITDSGKERIMG